MKLTGCLIFFLLIFNSCTGFKKELAKPVVVALTDSSFITAINSNANYTKYSQSFSKEQLATAFLKGFRREAAFTKNVTLKNTETNADFVVKIKSLAITESSRIDKINDPKSKYNGQEVELNVVDCRAEVEIVDAKNRNKPPQNCSNSKSRSEHESTGRNLDDLINGTNKDHTEYRTKLLDVNICMNLSEDVGRRIWVPITRRIAREIK